MERVGPALAGLRLAASRSAFLDSRHRTEHDERHPREVSEDTAW